MIRELGSSFPWHFLQFISGQKTVSARSESHEGIQSFIILFVVKPIFREKGIDGNSVVQLHPTEPVFLDSYSKLPY